MTFWDTAQQATKAENLKNMDEMKIILGMLICTDSIDTDIFNQYCLICRLPWLRKER